MARYAAAQAAVELALDVAVRRELDTRARPSQLCECASETTNGQGPVPAFFWGRKAIEAAERGGLFMRLIDVLFTRHRLGEIVMSRKAEAAGEKTRAAEQPVVTSSGQLSWSVRDILFSHQREAAVRTLRDQPPRRKAAETNK